MTLERVADAVEELPPADREALLLFAWEELTYQQISEAQGVPVGTVRSRLHRARASVRERISASGKEQWQAKPMSPERGRP